MDYVRTAYTPNASGRVYTEADATLSIGSYLFIGCNHRLYGIWTGLWKQIIAKHMDLLFQSTSAWIPIRTSMRFWNILSDTVCWLCARDQGFFIGKWTSPTAWRAEMPKLRQRPHKRGWTEEEDKIEQPALPKDRWAEKMRKKAILMKCQLWTKNKLFDLNSILMSAYWWIVKCDKWPQLYWWMSIHLNHPPSSVAIVPFRPPFSLSPWDFSSAVFLWQQFDGCASDAKRLSPLFVAVAITLRQN